MRYMDYIMLRRGPLKLLLNMYPVRRARGFEINGMDYHEVFRPKIVNRPGGVRDWHFVQFHSPVKLLVGGQLLDYSPETFMISAPATPEAYGNPRKFWSHSWLHFDGPGIDAVVRASGVPLNRPFHLPDTSIIDEILPAIHAELIGHRRPDPVILENLVEIWVHKLRRCLPGAAAPAIPSRILAARAYLDQNLGDPVKLGQLAEIVGMSASHLSAEFREHVGTPPMRYLLELRLRQAAYLLAREEAGIAEVARTVGFRDPLYFSRQFRKRFGSSPRAFRKTRRT
jgi:AraC family transcriptional regulator of arabinose operon